MRAGLLCLFCLQGLVACAPGVLDLQVGDGGEIRTRDASVGMEDAAAASPLDAGNPEGPVGDAGAPGNGTRDAGSGELEDGGVDTGPSSDGGADAEAEPCSTGTRDGVCLHVDDCGVGSEPVPGFCPGPNEIQCCVPVDEGACVEAPEWDEMPRPNEGLTEEPGDPGCLDGMAAVTTFCVDRYEAALIEVLSGGSERHWSPYFNPGDRTVKAVSLPGGVPQGYISGQQAQAACAVAGKRLCSESEWTRACQGSQAWAYPYGSSRQDGVCNDDRSVHPVVDYFDSSDSWVWSNLDHPCINQQADSLASAGANTGCASEDGAYDLMGNLHEWVADPAGTFRGGFYADTEVNGQGCLYRTTAHSFSYWDYSTGFRCCADLQ